MKVLWRALNGQDFSIEGENLDEIREKIELLRKKHNIDKPNVILAKVIDENIRQELESSVDIDIKDLPEELQEKFKQAENLAEEEFFIKKNLN